MKIRKKYISSSFALLFILITNFSFILALYSYKEVTRSLRNAQSNEEARIKNSEPSYIIYEEEGCKGKNLTFLNSHNFTKANDLWRFGTVRSRSINGVWKESLESQTSSGDSLWNAIFGRICIENNKIDGGRYAQLKSIRNLMSMSSHQNSTLSLYTQQSFEGEELYFDGTFLKLPYSIPFKSWTLRGDSHWTVFPKIDLEGDSKCLSPKNQEDGAIESLGKISYLEKTKDIIYVGSISKGCESNAYRRMMSTKYKMNDEPGLILYIEHEVYKSPKSSEITLFQLTNRRELVTNAPELRLPHPLFVSAFSFTGKTQQNWTVFESVEKNSPFKCVYNFVNSSSPEQVIIEEKISIYVQKIVRGCVEDSSNEYYRKRGLSEFKINSSAWTQYSISKSVIMSFNLLVLIAHSIYLLK